MAKRLIIPDKQTMTVAAGSGEVTIPAPTGIPGLVLTYLVIEQVIPGASAPVGKVQIYDVDLDQVIRKDPKPGNNNVILDFYHYEMRVPLNGTYKVRVRDVDTAGDYVVYTVTEERPRSV